MIDTLLPPPAENRSYPELTGLDCKISLQFVFPVKARILTLKWAIGSACLGMLTCFDF